MLPPDSSAAAVQNPGIPQVSPSVSEKADAYREAFVSAKPFKHLSIDDFFTADFAERLYEEFPRFNPELARNEMGNVAGKAVNTKIREISPAYRELYETIGGQPFLELMSRISGIRDLILDPRMYGGGTHENLHGQELDPHVDFNYDEAQQLHRRLNVIVYLNPGWQTEWGGAIEVHSNPRDPATNQIRGFDPIFNRCVMFETNEISWHGFPKITLPPDKRDLSRKSISIYLYTKTRPAEEIAPVHGTFYVQRPMPDRFREGLTLSNDDVAELKNLLWRRDIWVEHYQKLELEKNRERDAKSADIRTMMANYDSLTVDAKFALASAEKEKAELRAHLEAYGRLRDSLQAEKEALLAQVGELQQGEEASAAALTAERQNVRVPITGYAVQTGALVGIHSDLWAGARAEIGLEPRVRVSRIRLHGWRPENSPRGKLRMSVGLANVETNVSSGLFSIELPLPHEYREPFRVIVECEVVTEIGGGPLFDHDARALSFKWVELEVLHPPLALIAKVLK
jgi:hypothetical protein